MRPCTILVIEDNPITLKMLRLALESEGFAVVGALDGATALEAMAQRRPDLILQDLMLPDVDGFGLVKQLRRLPGGSEIPILACSGFLSKIEQARTLQIGFTDFLFKPVEPSRLLTAIRAYVRPRAEEKSKRGQGRRVLIAEDDPLQLKLEKLCLEQVGFEVVTAQDGGEALELARRAPPDAIVSDVLMPRLDGFRLCHAVREDPQLGSIPLVLFSSVYDEDADFKLARMVGANALVLRSPDFQEVIEAIFQGLDAAAPSPLPPVKLVSEEYVSRIIRQLERQVAVNRSLSSRLALREAELSIFTGFAETLRRSSTVEKVLEEVLYRCLDAGGVSRGAAYLFQPDGSLSLEASIGFLESAREPLRCFFGHVDRLRRMVENGEAVLMGPPDAEPEPISELLQRADATCILLTPIVSSTESLGALVMASQTKNLTADWLDFAKGLGYQVGHAITLTRAFSQLEAAEERYRGIFETSIVGIYRSTVDGRVEVANPALARIFGYSSPQELIDRVTDVETQIYVDPDRRRELLRRLSEEGAVSEFECEMRRKDESKIWVSDSARAVRDPSGRLVAMEGVNLDVTPRRRMEEALRQREKLAAMGSLLAGVAHELNNPLSIVLGTVSLLEQEVSGRLAERVEQISKAAERCARTVRNFLALARQQPSQREAVNLNKVVEDGLELLSYPLRVEGVNVQVELAQALPPLRADPHQLQQVVVNLVTNAQQAMHETRGPRRLTVGTIYDAAENRVHLQVADSGPGVPPDLRSRVFDPFFTTKAPGQGTGMGLAICHGIVEDHGGTIRVEGEPGQGAVFIVELPVGAPPVKVVEVRQARNEPTIQPRTILVVDDEPMIGNLLSSMLGIEGHRVDQATDGLQALNQIRARAYDLILSDMRMPELDGPGLYREVERSNAELCKKFAFITGDELSFEVKTFLEQAGRPTLSKPFTLAEVRQLLRDALAAGPRPE